MKAIVATVSSTRHTIIPRTGFNGRTTTAIGTTPDIAATPTWKITKLLFQAAPARRPEMTRVRLSSITTSDVATPSANKKFLIRVFTQMPVHARNASDPADEGSSG